MKKWIIMLHIDAEDDYTQSDLVSDMTPVMLPPGVNLVEVEAAQVI